MNYIWIDICICVYIYIYCKRMCRTSMFFGCYIQCFHDQTTRNGHIYLLLVLSNVFIDLIAMFHTCTT